MKVCAGCFADFELRTFIRQNSVGRGCDFCGGFDSDCAEIEDVCDRVEDGIEKMWGRAVEQLPYESREGGYQGSTWDTDEVLQQIGLELPRDRGSQLWDALIRKLPNEQWCDWDWLRLDEDQILKSGWDTFCTNVKYRRRFFFHHLVRNPDDEDSYSASRVLNSIAVLCQELGLIKEIAAGVVLRRARTDLRGSGPFVATHFGPPPRDKALQSNRMNPPGIPMLYLASTGAGAVREIRKSRSKVGSWRLRRSIRVLDLRTLPTGGLFSEATRREILGTRFLWHFRDAIMIPVDRDERVHVDYLPSQVATEYLGDYPYEGGRLEAVVYPSTVDRRSWNLAVYPPASPAEDQAHMQAMFEFVGWSNVRAR